MKFSQLLLNWWDINGRKDLPWQQNKTAYRVWVSEIMLQQTQVKTVIPYYQNFMTSFPDIETLAVATEDDVLQHWTGLGYYARARNIHKTAKIVANDYSYNFPQVTHLLEALPGIGRSTAGAIASFAFNQTTAILDGNVKRVLTRVNGIAQWPGDTTTIKKLWQISESETPTERTADYNQAIMDLGATLCTRSKPQCLICPMKNLCTAFKKDLVAQIPGKKAKKQIPVKDCILAIVSNADGHVLLEKRPSQGIWGSLYCFPQFATAEDFDNFLMAQNLTKTKAKTNKNAGLELATITHKFSHFTLNISPICIQTDNEWHTIAESESRWIHPKDALTRLGLPTPVKKLLEQIGNPDD